MAAGTVRVWPTSTRTARQRKSSSGEKQPIPFIISGPSVDMATMGGADVDYGASVGRHIYNEWLADFHRCSRSVVSCAPADVGHRRSGEATWKREHGLRGQLPVR